MNETDTELWGLDAIEAVENGATVAQMVGGPAPSPKLCTCIVDPVVIACGAIPPTTVFDAVINNLNQTLRRQIEDSFSVLVRPRGLLRIQLQEGDLVIRKAIGQESSGQVSVVVSGKLYSKDALAAAGLEGEAGRDGMFAHVVEFGPRPLRIVDGFARQIVDSLGRLPADQFILRPLSPSAEFIEASIAEDIVRGKRDCSALSIDCLSPPQSDLTKIRPKGNPDGDFLDRTEGDRSVNFALQLVDYDVNAYQPNKRRHAEALVRIREFVVARSVQTPEDIAVTITGTASRTGRKEYNDILSCKRALCAADNLRVSLSFFKSVLDRVHINPSGEGFTRATCSGGDCELGEWRSVLIQVHAPGAPPPPIHPVDPGWDKYTIRCCSYHTEGILDAALGDLIKKGLPNIPDALRGTILEQLKKGIEKLSKVLLKDLPKLQIFMQEFGELLKFFPAQIIRESGVFQIHELDRPNPREITLCYSGFGLRIILPREKLDDFLDDIAGKVPLLPDDIKRKVKEEIKKLVPRAVKTLIQPIDSDTPGPIARFQLNHSRNMKIFEGGAQTGKSFWMPGQVNLEFNSPPWRVLDKLNRPIITACPDTDCNEAGVQTVVGDGLGFELFSITQGSLIKGACICAVAPSAILKGLVPKFGSFTLPLRGIPV